MSTQAVLEKTSHRAQTSDSPLTFRFLAAIPAVYAGLLPFVLLDAFLSIYQAVCFGVWGIPKVNRSRYLRFDRSKLPYLNWYQRVNCHYCSYANGLAAYFFEIAARTEQYWCPIRHEHDPESPHSRYQRFLRYGDRQAFERWHETVRRGFDDLDSTR